MSRWLQMALKCTDLGHLAAPWAVHQRWVAGLEEELFRQGDNEKQLHMLVSPLMDRSKEASLSPRSGTSGNWMR